MSRRFQVAASPRETPNPTSLGETRLRVCGLAAFRLSGAFHAPFVCFVNAHCLTALGVRADFVIGFHSFRFSNTLHEV